MHVSGFAEGEREDCAFQVPNLREEHPQGQAWKRFRRLRFQRKVEYYIFSNNSRRRFSSRSGPSEF